MFDIRRERMVRSLVLAVVGIALFGLLRPASPDPQEDVRVHETWFWLHKTHAHGRYDLVVVGDSRAVRGISPAAMETELDEVEVFNLAYNAGGLNSQMYAIAEASLDRETRRPAILLAITPLAFQDWKAGNAQYQEYRVKPWDQVLFYEKAVGVAAFLQPVSPSVPLRRLLGLSPPYRTEQVFHPDGWIETTQKPAFADPDLELSRRRLAGNRVSSVLCDELLEQTARWVAQDIAVFGCRPPTPTAVARMEDEILGFDEAGFVDRFRRAGGVWLSVAPDGYALYDGSHLDAESAVRFSRELGRAIGGHLAPPKQGVAIGHGI